MHRAMLIFLIILIPLSTICSPPVFSVPYQCPIIRYDGGSEAPCACQTRQLGCCDRTQSFWLKPIVYLGVAAAIGTACYYAGQRCGHKGKKGKCGSRGDRGPVGPIGFQGPVGADGAGFTLTEGPDLLGILAIVSITPANGGTYHVLVTRPDQSLIDLGSTAIGSSLISSLSDISPQIGSYKVVVIFHPATPGTSVITAASSVALTINGNTVETSLFPGTGSVLLLEGATYSFTFHYNGSATL